MAVITVRSLFPIMALVSGVALASGCGGDSDGDDSCVVPCESYQQCADGVVTSYGGTMPCGAGGGACQSLVVVQCTHGCRADVTIGHGDPGALCEENRAKQLGDACTVDDDCRPEVGVEAPDGTFTTTYLRCDTAAGQCVARPAPTVVDWLAPCGLTLDNAPLNGGFLTWLETDQCSAGVCLYRADATCVAQGCISRCTTDGDCPAGADCDGELCIPGPFTPGPAITCPP